LHKVRAEQVAADLIGATVRSLRHLGPNAALASSTKSQILKMIKVVQAYPKELGPLLQRSLAEPGMPLWAFVGFLPQMISSLASERLAPYFLEFFEFVVERHPEHLVY
jgi:hypothetical protein